MKDIILSENIFRISHRVIAEKTKVQPNSIVKLLHKYKNDFEEFGQIIIESEKFINSIGATHKRKIYYLNEAQIMFLILLMKNNPIVIEFKITFIKYIYSMNHLLEKQKIDKIKFKKEKNETLSIV